MKKLLLTIYLLLLGGALFAAIPASEKAALLDLYTQTKGEDWNKTWALDQEVVHWDGITITDGHVTEIRMLFNNLDGSLPNSLGNLEYLKVLELSFNKINGPLPDSLGKLSQLEILALNGNFLSGNIPSSFGNLKNLKQLHLSSNALNGALPASLNQLTQLEVFNVFQNQLTGDLPIGLAKSRSLKEFMVAENNFNANEEISTILLSNSAKMHVTGNEFQTTGKQIIALETEEEN